MLLSLSGAFAQHAQLWFDAYGYKNIGEKWQYEANVGYNTIKMDSAWHDIYWSNTFSWDVVKWYGLEGSAEFNFSNDPREQSIVELNLQLNQVFTFIQYVDAIHLSQPYLGVKFESRFLWYPEADTSDIKYRSRFRLGGKFIVNNTSLQKKTIYVPFYFESFFNINGEAVERKAEKARGKIGLGYVFSDRWRGELGYMAQLARNTITDDVDRTDYVLEFKIRYYFDK